MVVAAFSDGARAGIGASVSELAAALEIPLRPAADVRDPALAAQLGALELDLLVNVHSLHIVAGEVLEDACARRLQPPPGSAA